MKKEIKNTTTDNNEKKSKLVRWVIDPETGKKISKTWYAFKKAQKQPVLEVYDMRAVLK